MRRAPLNPQVTRRHLRFPLLAFATPPVGELLPAIALMSSNRYANLKTALISSSFAIMVQSDLTIARPLVWRSCEKDQESHT